MLSGLATAQHGFASRVQLLEAGLTSREIKQRVAAGILHPYYRGVYAVGHTAITEYGRLMAAVLASGEGSAISFFDAAALWELLPAREGPIHVSRAGPRRDARTGIVLHGVTEIETTRRHNIPVTTPLQTILDLAATAPDRDLAHATNEARRKRLITTTTLLTRAVHRPGAARLRGLTRSEPQLTRSEAERRLLDLIDRAKLPRPTMNARVAGFEVDALWPQQRLVVEVDGYAFHRTRDSFERDRRKDATLIAAGYRTIRLTWRRLVDEPEATVALLAQALAQRAVVA